MVYALENSTEFERLEKQSRLTAYDFRSELHNVAFNPNGKILDAGCGSGIVSRYLATLYPNAQVTGSDFSQIRVLQAEKENDCSNLRFTTEDLSKTSFPNHFFSDVLCRYVIEHLPESLRATVFEEFYRIIRPGGKICIIDVDGFLFNSFPQTTTTMEVLQKFSAELPFDLNIGRKIPFLLNLAGFQKIDWSCKTFLFKDEAKNSEIEQMSLRFSSMKLFLENFLGKQKAQKFRDEFLTSMEHPQSVVFQTMFTVTAEKSSSALKGLSGE